MQPAQGSVLSSRRCDQPKWAPMVPTRGCV